MKITLKHPDEKVVAAAATALAGPLRQAFPGRVLGPEVPLVSRIQNYFLQEFWVKLPKDNHLASYKLRLREILKAFQSAKEHKTVRVVVNVDA